LKATKEGDQQSSGEERNGKRMKSEADPQFEHRILDIGTGSCCIYALLGCTLHADWCFVGTDIDEISLAHAQGIVEMQERLLSNSSSPRFRKHNTKLSSQISLILRRPDDNIIPHTDDLLSHTGTQMQQTLPQTLYSATMCNPPFYKDEEEMTHSSEKKRKAPNAVCHGSAGEMICEGGEVAFVRRIIAESVTQKHLSVWYTTMIGKLSDVEPVIGELKACDIDNYLVAEFSQGVTKRWAVAWSHFAFRLPPPSTSISGPLKSLQPSTGQHIFNLHTDHSKAQGSCEQIQNHLSVVKNISQIPVSATSVYAVAPYDTWSRKARRRAAQGHEEDRPRNSEPELVVLIDFASSQADLVLTVTWAYGQHRQVFESFVMSVIAVWVRIQGKQTDDVQ
jgi:23S rRNA A1618 N6-methylase RlmF